MNHHDREARNGPNEEGRGVRNAIRAGTEVLLVIVAFVFHGWYARHGLAEFDTGILIADAHRLLRGEIFGRDFMAPYGPFRYYLLAAAFKAFSESLVTVAWVFAFLRTLADWLSYRLCRTFLPPLAAFVPALTVAVAHGSLHKTFVAIAVALGLWALVRLAREPSRANALFCGLAVGLAATIRYDAAAFLAIATVMVALVGALGDAGRRRQWVVRLFTVGSLSIAVVVLVAVPLFVAGFRPAWWWRMTWQRIAVQEWIEKPFPWPIASWEAGQPYAAMTGVYLLLTPVVLLAGLAVIVWWLRRSKTRAAGRALLAVWILALFMLNQARLIPSLNHFLQGALPFIVLGATVSWCCLQSWMRAGSWRRVIAIVLFVLPSAVLISHASLVTKSPHPGSFTVAKADDVLYEHPRAGIYLPPIQRAVVAAVVATIERERREGDTLACSHSSPHFYFLTDMEAALPVSEPSYYYRDERIQRECLEVLREKDPAFFIFDPAKVVGYDMQTDAPLLLEGILSRMRPLGKFGRLQLFVKTER